MSSSSPSSPTSGLSIIIVGAGTAGLTAALALQGKGHNITVLERSNALRLTGGSYRLNPPVTRLFASLGLDSELWQVATSSPGVRMRRYDTGDIIWNIDTDVGTEWQAMTIERQKAAQVLYEKAVDSGVRVLFGKRVVDVDETIPSLRLEDGTSLKADLLLGADGANSLIRKSLFPQTSDSVKVYNEVAYNIHVSRKTPGVKPGVKELWDDDFTNWWIGPGGYVIAGSPSPDEYLMGVFVENKTLSGERAKWHPVEDLSEVRKQFSNWDPMLSSMLAGVTKSEYWRIIELPDLPNWSSPSGKIILIGDAAHAIGPHAGSGAAMGVEDGFALAELLSIVKTPKDLQQVARLFETLRKPRVKTVWRLARANWTRMTLPDGPAQQQRDRLTKALWGENAAIDWSKVKPDSTASGREPAFQKWLNDYDVREEAQKLLREQGESITQSKL